MPPAHYCVWVPFTWLLPLGATLKDQHQALTSGETQAKVTQRVTGRLSKWPEPNNIEHIKRLWRFQLCKFFANVLLLLLCEHFVSKNILGVRGFLTKEVIAIIQIFVAKVSPVKRFNSHCCPFTVRGCECNLRPNELVLIKVAELFVIITPFLYAQHYIKSHLR